MNKNKTNTLLLTIIGVATLLVSVVGATFAFFTARISGAEDATTITVGSGSLSIAYEDTKEFYTEENIEPRDDAIIEKTFTITGNNSTETVMPYEIEMVVQENSFTEDALSYILSSTNSNSNGVVAPAISETGIPNVVAVDAETPVTPQNISLGSGYFVNATNAVHTYKLDIYFRETGVPQDEDKNKTFKGYVNTIVKEAYTTTTIEP